MVSSGISGNIIPVRKAATTSSKVSQKPEADFGMLMSESLSANSLQMGTKAKEMETDKNSFSQNTVAQNAVTQNTGAAWKEQLNKSTEAKELTDSATQKNKDALKDNPEVKEALDEIRNKIKEEFGVTEEELEAVLETLGFTLMDLLQSDNLTDFVVELTGMETSIELLTSSDAALQLEELESFINGVTQELSEELGIPVEELMKELMEELPESKTGQMPQTEEKTELDEEFLPEKTVEESKNMPETVDSKEKISSSEKQQKEMDSISEQQTNEIKITRTEAKASSSKDGMEFSKHQENSGLSENVVNQFTNAVNEAFEMKGLDQVVDSVKIINQIVETAKITLNQEVTSMELMLNPENLGKVNLNVSVKAGVVTASIVAQNEAVREAIESQVVLLKENLSNQGIKVEAVEVTVESHAFEAGTNQGQNNRFQEPQEESKKNHRPLRLDSLKDLSMEDLTEEEKIVLDMMEEEGNQVNFTA